MVEITEPLESWDEERIVVFSFGQLDDREVSVKDSGFRRFGLALAVGSGNDQAVVPTRMDGQSR